MGPCSGSKSSVIRVPRWWRVLSAAGMIFGFFFGGPIAALVAIPYVWFGGPAKERHLRARSAIAKGYRGYLQLIEFLGLGRFHVTRRSPPHVGAAVYVANHPCLLDTVTMCAEFGPVCLVVKHTRTRSFFFTIVYRMCQYLVVREGSFEEADALLEEAVRKLRAGESMMIFPEGSRSPLGGLHTFSRTAFEIAGRAGVPVIPVALTESAPVLAKGSSVLSWPDEVVEFGFRELAPVFVGEGRAAARAARDQVQTALAEAVKLRQSPPPEGTDGPVGALHGA